MLRGLAIVLGFTLFAIGMLGFMGGAFPIGSAAPLCAASGIAALDDGHVLVTIENPPRLQTYAASGAFLDSKRLDWDGVIRIRRDAGDSVEVGTVRGGAILRFSSDGSLLDQRRATSEEIVDFPSRRFIAVSSSGRQFRLAGCHIETRTDEEPWRVFVSDSLSRVLMYYGWFIGVAGLAINLLAMRPYVRAAWISSSPTVPQPPSSQFPSAS